VGSVGEAEDPGPPRHGWWHRGQAKRVEDRVDEPGHGLILGSPRNRRGKPAARHQHSTYADERSVEIGQEHEAQSAKHRVDTRIG
jgi:hypothetical protein